MKKALVAAGILGMVAFGATPALAHDQISGGCSFSANSPPESNNTFTGEISVVAHSHNGGVPATTTFDCELQVNGNPVGTISATTNAAGVAANAAPISYTRNPGDTVVLCETVTHSDGHVTSDCLPATSVEIPPPLVRDLIIQVTSIPDFLLCPQLVALQGTYLNNLLVIDGEGDVYFPAPGKFWDCPPYDPPTA